MVIKSIQKTKDTVTPLINLAAKGIIGEDREALLLKYKETNTSNEEKKKEKLMTKMTLNSKVPISPALMADFKENALELNPNWIESITTMSKMEWQSMTLKMICGVNIDESQYLREYVVMMMKGSGTGVSRYSFLHHVLKRNKNSKKVLYEEDKDCLLQVYYFCLILYDFDGIILDSELLPLHCEKAKRLEDYRSCGRKFK